MFQILYDYFISDTQTLPHGESPHEKYLRDLELYGSQDRGTYRGIKWIMSRPYCTFWSGSIDESYDLTSEQLLELAKRSHGNLSAKLGFSCNLEGDYYDIDLDVNVQKYTIYRDHNYVLGKLHDMIDYLKSIGY